MTNEEHTAKIKLQEQIPKLEQEIQKQKSMIEEYKKLDHDKRGVTKKQQREVLSIYNRDLKSLENDLQKTKIAIEKHVIITHNMRKYCYLCGYVEQILKD